MLACLGLCMQKITTAFPFYDLHDVKKDIQHKCKDIRGGGGGELVKWLPNLPPVGGETDILIRIKYARYFPKIVFAFETGLGIFKSVFKSPCDTRGIVGDPHREFSKVEKNNNTHVIEIAYFQAPTYGYRLLWQLGRNIPLLGEKYIPNMYEVDAPPCGAMANDNPVFYPKKSFCRADRACVAKRTPKCVKLFDEVENLGTEITFRCVDCRSCAKCKNGARFEALSTQEEIEQSLIERCINIRFCRLCVKP